MPLDPPAEPVEEVEPEEEEVAEGDAVAEQPSGEIIAEAKSTKSIKSEVKESIPPQSNKGELDNVDDFEEHVKPERVGLGKISRFFNGLRVNKNGSVLIYGP